MKKRLFRERYQEEDTMEKFIKNIVEYEEPIEDPEPIKVTVEEPKKRGRKKSVK